MITRVRIGCGGERQWLRLHNLLTEADKWVYGEIGP